MTSSDKNIPKHEYDAVIIGAGPAGGQFARELALRGHSVLLVEQSKNFDRNNFSSAGSTLEILREFDLPESTVGSRWSRLRIGGPSFSTTWKSGKTLGVVLDFARLREFLAEEAKGSGAKVLLHHTFKSLKKTERGVDLELQNNTTDERFWVRTRLAVDATGYRRAVIGQVRPKKTVFQEGVGLEYLVEVDPARYFADELVFFLGQRHMPKGYGWIFPMRPNLLKIGVGYLGTQPPGGRSLKSYCESLITNQLPGAPPRVVDIHGGKLAYARKLDDVFYADGVLAVGDAVSAVNPLGGEGIRHGMRVARFAAEAACEALKKGGEKPFKAYERQSRVYYGSRWGQSLFLADMVYGKFSDARLDQMLGAAARFSADQLMQILFEFKFGAAIFSLGGITQTKSEAV